MAGSVARVVIMAGVLTTGCAGPPVFQGPFVVTRSSGPSTPSE